MFQIRNVFHEKIIQFLVVFILWHFESFLLSVVVATISIGEASIAVVAKAVVAVVGISRRLGSGGSLGGPLAVDNGTIGIGVASIAVMTKAIVAVVRISLGIGLRGAHGQGDHGENNLVWKNMRELYKDKRIHYFGSSQVV